MSFARELKRRIRDSVAPVLFASLTGYFCWNATQGDLGLRAYALRQQDLIAAQSNLAHAQADQAAWERRVAALRTNRLDPDVLEERARALLNLADPADIVVPYAPDKKLF